MRIVVKEPKEDIKIIETTKQYRTECVKEIIGEKYYLEYITVTADEEHMLSLAVIEDGLMRELPPNILISTTSPIFPIQILVGPVVFVKTKYENAYIKDIWDFEVEDITDEDLELIKQMTDFKTQEVLFEAFKELQNK